MFKMSVDVREAAGRVNDLIADLKGEHEVMCGPFDPSKWKIEVPVTDLLVLAKSDISNASVEARLREALEVLNYVANNTYCGADAEWHFKGGYNPQVVLDACNATAGGDEAKKSDGLCNCSWGCVEADNCRHPLSLLNASDTNRKK